MYARSNYMPLAELTTPATPHHDISVADTVAVSGKLSVNVS